MHTPGTRKVQVQLCYSKIETWDTAVCVYVSEWVCVHVCDFYPLRYSVHRTCSLNFLSMCLIIFVNKETYLPFARQGYFLPSLLLYFLWLSLVKFDKCVRPKADCNGTQFFLHATLRLPHVEFVCSQCYLFTQLWINVAIELAMMSMNDAYDVSSQHYYAFIMQGENSPVQLRLLHLRRPYKHAIGCVVRPAATKPLPERKISHVQHLVTVCCRRREKK